MQDRIKRLNVEIVEIEENAKQFASSAEDLARLTRDMKIAEATFTVLTEQVKSQSLVAGFKPDTFKVYAYASPPLSPSSPNIKLILVLGAILGVFLGSIISILNGIRIGAFYTSSSITTKAQPVIALKSNSLHRIARLELSKLIISIEKNNLAGLDEATVTLAPKKLIYVANTVKNQSASQIASLLAAQSYQSGKHILLFHKTKSKKNFSDSKVKNIAGLSIEEIHDRFDVIRDLDEFSFFTSNNFEKQFNQLLSSYDQIFISSNKQNSNAALIALRPFKPGLVVMTSLRRTSKELIQKLRSIHPISILFHD